MTAPTLEQTLARLRAIQDSPHTPGWDSRARVDAINAFVQFHYGIKHKLNLTEAFVTLLIEALEHELNGKQLQGHEYSGRWLTRAGAKFLGSDVNAERAGRTA